MTDEPSKDRTDESGVVTIELERAYDEERKEGTRVLVDRIWPRGVSKDELGLDEWRKQVAPTDSLREWFDHDPGRWGEFRKRYFEELEEDPETWEPLLETAREGTLVLVYGARDRRHNNAVALREFLEDRE